MKKTHISIALAVVVRESDAAPPGNFIVAPETTKVTVKGPPAPFVKISVNEDAPDDTGKRKVIVDV